MSGLGAIFVFIGVMPVLTNIIVTTPASSNLLSPDVPRLFVSDLCQAPISNFGLWPQIYQWNQCKITDAEVRCGVMHVMNDLSSPGPAHYYRALPRTNAHPVGQVWVSGK